jgi:L-threonylcarbamoyladenylate synthase
MSAPYDCADAQQREAGIAAAVTTVRSGGLVVLPTDTVYGLGADAFSPEAVSRLLAVREQERRVPPSVLVGSVRAATALAESLGAFGQDLIDEFWPGPLTLVLRASSTLKWDLGDTNGTVAIRMPLHPVALELLRRTGPLAVSSANKTGFPTGPTVADAQARLGDAVEVYLDGGPCTENPPSSIVDLTNSMPRLLRAGAITADQLRKVIPVIEFSGDRSTGVAQADPPPGDVGSSDDASSETGPADVGSSNTGA